jgi:RNA polymerase sigma factor (sigma-70 family)
MKARENFTEKAERDLIMIKNALEENDQNCFYELFNQYRRPIFYMMYKMTSSEQDAEDLLVETFQKASENLSSYTTSFTFSTWLFGIATNNCIDFMLKKRQRFAAASIDDFSDQEIKAQKLISANHKPEQTLIKKQQEEFVNKAIKK